MGFILALLLTSPFSYDPCAGLEELEWRLCQPRVVVIGPWNPLPYDYSPPTAVYMEPRGFGAYSTEQRPNSCKYGIAE